ncbi:two-component regulator propeller domain-containing protein [Olivibacter ginsenosidimutans]|uniref:histidine kinase n=1 Tax=Olivibacter ginsenosidimutans TaxID=1176537 RepID=A0ABP9C0F3_9SPHI
MIRKLTLTCLICFLIKLANSQPYYFKHYQVENGLSNNAVICSLQDSKGFMWFGTRDGLNRFDGYTFKVFRHNILDTADMAGLGHNFIQSLCEDATGRIWAGTDFGIYIYDPLTEGFSAFPYNKNAPIINIRSDTAGNMWYTADYRTLVRYNLKTKQVHYYDNLGLSSIDALALSPKGIWLGSGTGELKLFDPELEKTIPYDVFNASSPIRDKAITSLLWDENHQRLWIGTSKQGIKRFFPKDARYEDLMSTADDGQEIFVRDIKKIGTDQYWFATESGVYIYSDQSRQFIQLKKQDDNRWSLSDNANYSICQDNEGGVWIGSWFGGISYYHEKQRFFEKFFPLNTATSLSGNAVREICEDNDHNLWIGTENGGLNKLAIHDMSIEHFKPDGSRNAISGLNIHGLLVTGDTLWVGTFHQGLNLMRISTGEVFKHYYADEEKNGLKSNFIYTMLRTHSGRILFATDHGIYEYLFDKKKFKLLEEFPEYIFYTCLFEDSEGTIWVGTWRDGLYFYNPSTKKRGVYYYDQQNIHSLPSNRITHIMETSDHQLWAATEEGIGRLDRKNNRFERLNFQHAIPGQGVLVLAFLEDDRHNVWISTSRGLILYNLTTGYTRKFTIANGLLSDQFNYNSAYKAKNGMLYFGSVKGLIRFQPDKLQDKVVVPPIYITGFQLYDKDLEINGNGSPLKKSIAFTDSLVLNYNQSSFSIDFAALSYISPDMTEYTYKMEGLEPNWTYLQTNRKAYFTELPPGVYTFKVSSVNSEGKRIGKEATLWIRILPPYWASPLAYTLYFLLLIGIIWLLVRTYHRWVKEKNRIKLVQIAHRKEEEMYRSKIEFFTQVAHEIRTPLTLIKGPMEKIIKQVDEVPKIRKNLLIMEKNTDRLLELSGQLLDFRKTEVKGYKLNYQLTDITKFLRDQIDRIRPTALERKLKIKIDLPKELLFASVDIETLEKIVSNLLNNALKYAAGKIMINLKAQDKIIRIEVASDGDLIPGHLKEKIFESFYRVRGHERYMGTGLGLALARSLTEMHGGTLVLDTQNQENFNTFVLTLPLNQEGFDND